MFSNKTRSIRRWVMRLLFGLCFLGASYGYWGDREDDLKDKQRVALFERAFGTGDIRISQPEPGAPLMAHVTEYSQLAEPLKSEVDEGRWLRLRRLTFRFAAAVNQGLGDPFLYNDGESDGRATVTGVKARSLAYNNPFEGERTGPVTTPINSSEVVARSRHGWRIVSRNLVLYLQSDLRPGLPGQAIDAGLQNVCEVGHEFLLGSARGSDVTLRLTVQGEGGAQFVRLDPRGVDGRGRVGTPITRRHGEYFVWDGRPFGVFRADTEIGGADSSAVGDLVFTKEVNGRPVRMQVLGRATANLIGSPVGGETRYIDGAFAHGKAKRLVLTIDPEIQSAAFYLLNTGLRELSANPSSLTRERRGAITVLDGETGQILAHAGAPGYDPLWEGSRVILADRQRITDNPANATHNPGSTVKVLTAAMGYLLTGEGSGEMLPTSINQLAIRQAFRNAYGGPLPPRGIVDDTTLARVTPEGRRYFDDNVGRPARRSDTFTQALGSAFNVMDRIPESHDYESADANVLNGLYEQIAFGDFERYFPTRARYDFFPHRSRLPISAIDTVSTAEGIDRMDLFRMYAIGSSETRFTTLRLAALLRTAATGQPIRPFIVESVVDAAVQTEHNRVTNQRANIFPDLREVLPNLEGANNGNSNRMGQVMRQYLAEVCISGHGHTGWYFNTANARVFMAEDDPATADMNERQLRQEDYGKTGTADYGALDNFNDSVFVYKHGRYFIAIWMERAEGQGVTHPAHRILNQLVSFIDRLNPPPRRGQ